MNEKFICGGIAYTAEGDIEFEVYGTEEENGDTTIRVYEDGEFVENETLYIESAEDVENWLAYWYSCDIELTDIAD